MICDKLDYQTCCDIYLETRRADKRTISDLRYVDGWKNHCCCCWSSYIWRGWKSTRDDWSPLYCVTAGVMLSEGNVTCSLAQAHQQPPAATRHQAHADLFSPAELGYCPVSSVQCTVALFVKRQINIYQHNYIIHLFICLSFIYTNKPDTENVRYMTGLLHEGIFHVQDLLQPAICESLPWAYVMCNWAQILICQRHWPRE